MTEYRRSYSETVSPWDLASSDDHQERRCQRPRRRWRQRGEGRVSVGPPDLRHAPRTHDARVIEISVECDALSLSRRTEDRHCAVDVFRGVRLM